MRIQKFMSQCGVASRRKSETYLIEGKVKVNGKVVLEPGFKIDPFVDIIEFKGQRLRKPELVYLMLNKPVETVTTVKDTHNRSCVMDLLPAIEGLHPVGRLDKNTEGLLLMTNDGELTYSLTHPSHELVKTYQGWVRGKPDQKSLEAFRKGMRIENYVTAPAEIRILKNENNRCLLEMKIHEGKKRQIRKMCQMMNTPIIELKRVAIGKLLLGELKIASFRYLTKTEIKYLKELDNDKNRISTKL